VKFTWDWGLVKRAAPPRRADPSAEKSRRVNISQMTKALAHKNSRRSAIEFHCLPEYAQIHASGICFGG